MIEERCDQILMSGMVFKGHVGVLAAEKLNGQPFQVDIILLCPRLAACETDQLNETIDYSAAFMLIKEIVEGSDYDLIERLAGEIASALLDRFSLALAVDVTVRKPQAPIDGQFDAMGIRIYRERSCLI